MVQYFHFPIRILRYNDPPNPSTGNFERGVGDCMHWKPACSRANADGQLKILDLIGSLFRWPMEKLRTTEKPASRDAF